MIGALQVEPEPRVDIEILAEPNSGVGGDVATPADDLH